MNKRSVIYARVSTDEQTKGYSLNTQVDACKQYAADCGYVLLMTFSEDYSGATIDRPQLNALRDFAAQEPIDVIIVYDIDRLARKSVYQALIEEEFLRLGVTVEYVIGQYDNSDEAPASVTPRRAHREENLLFGARACAGAERLFADGDPGRADHREPGHGRRHPRAAQPGQK